MTPEMQYIYMVYQEGSFSRAAEKLFVTQPALSIAIRRVEESIGMPLFDRKSKPISLTDAGRIYVETIEKTLLLEKEQQQKLDDIQNLATGHIRLGGSHYLNAYVLPDIIAGFSLQYPGVQLTIFERSAHELSSMLESHELDMTFNCNPQFVRNFPSHEMFEDNILLAVPVRDEFNRKYASYALTAAQVVDGVHRKSDTQRLSLAALAEPELILLRKGNNLHDRAWEMFETAGITPRVKLDLDQLVTACHLAEAGIAATLVSERIVMPSMDKLCFFPLDSPLATRIFYILLPHNAYVSVAVRRFVDYALVEPRIIL